MQITLRTEQQGTRTFEGVVLGKASSENEFHTDHPGDYAVSGDRRQKCSACRWLETTIYKTTEGSFIAHTVGRSIVPGEIDFARVTETTSAFELIELLTVKGYKPYLPDPSARALAQAADKDEKIRDAFVNRAVV
jgi:hypothetical protein